MSSEDRELVPDLIRKTINQLNETIQQKNDYITILENKIQELETENYFLRRNKKIERMTDGEGGEIEIEIVEMVEQAGYSTEENTSLCLLSERYVGFLKKREKTKVVRSPRVICQHL